MAKITPITAEQAYQEGDFPYYWLPEGEHTSRARTVQGIDQAYTKHRYKLKIGDGKGDWAYVWGDEVLMKKVK